MSKYEKITILTAVVGLVANVITITGLVSGFVIPKPEISFFFSKNAIAIISITLLFYFEAIILLFICKFYDRRIRIQGITKINRDDTKEVFVIFSFSYSLWTPTYLLWMLWVFAKLHGFFLVILGVFGIVLGGFLLVVFSITLYEVLKPYDDVDLNASTNYKANAADKKGRAAD